MPRPRSQAPNSGYYSPDPHSPTFSPPGDYTEFQTLRPDTPGTIGGYSVSSQYEKYDRNDVATPSPSHQGLLMSSDGQPADRSSTYYFSKEGGAATSAASPLPYEARVGRRGEGYNPAYYANAGGAGAGAAMSAKKRPNFIRRRPILFSFIVLAILAIIGVAAGVGISQATKSSNNKNLSSNSNADSTNGGTSGGTSGGSSSKGSSPTSTTSASAPKITSFAKWNWTDTNTKAYGVSLGSWLVIERWQLEDWVVQVGGPNAWDEFRLTQALGSNAASVLADHQNTWITEADMDVLQNAGVNIVRIPIGFWAFIPTVAGEPYVTTGYVDQLNKMLSWCYARNMYVMLDLHGMPGSQNGDQSSGHNTTDIQWFTQANQDRSDAFLKAVLDWYKGSNYSSIINSIGVVNEPRVINDDGTNTINQTRLSVTTAYYERSYATCVQYGIPMTFHHGFVPGSASDKMNTWRSFIAGKDPNFLLYEDHPYPGWFSVPLPGASDIQTAVCEYGAAAQNFPIPVIIGEYSAVNNLNSSSYTKTYLDMQMATYGWSAGSIFWNFKANTSTTQILAVRDQIMQDYSFLDLIQLGIIDTPGKGSNVRNFYTNLANPCGSFKTYGWSNPAGGSSSSRRRRDLDFAKDH